MPLKVPPQGTISAEGGFNAIQGSLMVHLQVQARPQGPLHDSADSGSLLFPAAASRLLLGEGAADVPELGAELCQEVKRGPLGPEFYDLRRGDLTGEVSAPGARRGCQHGGPRWMQGGAAPGRAEGKRGVREAHRRADLREEGEAVLHGNVDGGGNVCGIAGCALGPRGGGGGEVLEGRRPRDLQLQPPAAPAAAGGALHSQ